MTHILNAITVNALTKTFPGGVRAVNQVSFALPAGCILGVLGPNGAGKTTLVRLLNGILEPDHGSAAIFERPIASNNRAIRQQCGVMTESAACYDGLSGRDNLLFYAALFALTGQQASDRAATLINLLGLADVATRKVKTYSTGQRKRLLLARALLPQPALLFLDEPTSGLDPEGARAVNHLIRDLARQNGTTVLLCTHQLRYAEDLCDYYAFLHQGCLLGFGTFAELLQEKAATIYLAIRGEQIPADSGFELVETGVYRKAIRADDDAAANLTHLVQAGARIFEAQQQRMSLEDLYFAYQHDAMSTMNG